MFATQARALITRMHSGYSAGAAHMENNELRPSDKLLEKMGKKGELLAKKIGKIDLSTAGLQELKSDQTFLSKVSQVRDYSERGTRRVLLHKQKMSDREREAEKAAQQAAFEEGKGRGRACTTLSNSWPSSGCGGCQRSCVRSAPTLFCPMIPPVHPQRQPIQSRLRRAANGWLPSKYGSTARIGYVCLGSNSPPWHRGAQSSQSSETAPLPVAVSL